MKAYWIFMVSNFLGVFKRVSVFASSVTEARKIIEDKMEYFPNKVMFIKCVENSPEDCDVYLK